MRPAPMISASRTSSKRSTASPSVATMRSPGSNPASAAGPPGVTAPIIGGVTGWPTNM